jgi:hypothetical protein
MKHLILILTATILTGCSSSKEASSTELTRTIAELQEEGYTHKTAVLIAKVRLGIIKPNKEYKSIIED